MTSSLSPQDTLTDAMRKLALPRGARLLLAVSGGPDSVALLDTAARLAPTAGWALRIGHINHGLRGDESDADERFVRRLAGMYGLHIDVERVDVGDLAARAHQSIEVAAREARYRALRRWLRAWPGDVILTGHTLDDQAETVLLRLFRGSGVVGLGGMRSGGTILRPFLALERSVIRRALDDRAIIYLEDSSNQDRHFRRNALRLDVMPSILAMDPTASRLIARAAENLQIDSRYILAEAERALTSLALRSEPGGVGASLTTFRTLHPALRRHTLRLILRDVLGSLNDLDARHIAVIEDALLEGSSITHQLPHRLRIYTQPARFVISVGDPPAAPSPGPVTLPVPGVATFGAWTITARQAAAADFDAPVESILAVCGPAHALLDASQIGRELTVRSRRPGDRIQPVGVEGSRKVQDIFVDSKVPATERESAPLVTHDNDVIWVAGRVVNRRYVARQDSALLLHLSVKPA